MTGTIPSEYRDLALDSSNEMMAYDSRWVLGRYAEAAWHILQAGHGRRRMGQMMFDASDFTQAAADWLSAAACFDLATDPKRMHEALDRVQQLDREGKVPPERRDLHNALKEREEQLKALEQKLTQFQQGYTTFVGSAHAASHAALSWLLRQVRDLPGFPYLHTAIASQAGRLGQRTTAFEHLKWAEKFEPEHPLLESLRTSLLLVGNDEQREQGITRGREFLKMHPDMHDLRFLLAKCIAFPRPGLRGDWQEAAELLKTLTNGGSGAILTRLRALALAAILGYGSNQVADYRRHLAVFDRLAKSTAAQNEEEFVVEVREQLPQIFPQPNSAGPPTSARATQAPVKLDDSAVYRVFDQSKLLAA